MKTGNWFRGGNPKPQNPAQWLDKPKGISGVYAMRNLVNGKRYVGSSVNLNQRRLCHLNHAKHQRHKNKIIQHEFNMFGAEAFDFQILEECSPETIITREQWWLNFIKPEYNVQPNAGTCRGRVHSEEAKSRMSEAAKTTYKEGRKVWNLGKETPLETRLKISLIHKGKMPSAACFAASREASKKRIGSTLSEETKLKISAAHMGIKPSDESRRKMSISAKARAERIGAVGVNLKKLADSI